MVINKKIISLTGTIFAIASLLISGCEKDTTVYVPLEPAVITKTVFFSKDIVPIFSKSCALNGCHAAGGHNPTLTSELAYNSLINGNYINKTSPEKSLLYKRLTGAISPAMPTSGSPNPSNIEGLVLAWIKQGAKKN